MESPFSNEIPVLRVYHFIEYMSGGVHEKNKKYMAGCAILGTLPPYFNFFADLPPICSIFSQTLSRPISPRSAPTGSQITLKWNSPE